MKTAWTWSWTLWIAAMLMSGCAKFDLRKSIPWGEGADGRIEQPLRVEVAWVDTVLTKPDQKPIRGFGGRLFFFGPNNAQEPVKVDGTLVVYGFNETNRDPANVVPDRKTVYPAKEFAALYSKSKLGHSYSVWVPWDEAGGTQCKISLIARFTPKKGAVIASEQMCVLLPGTQQPLVNVQKVNSYQSTEPTQLTHNAPSENSPAGGVQLASYQEPSAAAANPSGISSVDANGRQLASLTIPLRGTQTQYFVQRTTNSGGAQVGTLSMPTAAGAIPGSTNAMPLAPPAAQVSAPPMSPSSWLPQAGLQASQSPTSQSPKGTSSPPQPTNRFEPVRPPARATLAAPPQFSRARLEPHPAIQQFCLPSSQSPATSPPPPDSSPGAAQLSKQGPADSGLADQIRR